MQEKRLSYQSFQQGQDVLAAINALLIHLKLSQNPATPEVVSINAEGARGKIIAFLGELDGMVRASQEERPILGADFRLRQLAHSLGSNQDYGGGTTKLEITGLLEALGRYSPAEYPELIEGLTQLRRVIERHIQEDALQVLGEL